MERMPVLFVGHGSPMNAIEKNPFTEGWKNLSLTLPHPQAIVMVSAHWYGPGLKTSDSAKPRMVYDMYGFPNELYRIRYPAPGSPKLAERLKTLLGPSLTIDNTWGIDHGAWSVLLHLFPKADIPLVQLSVDASAPIEKLYDIGQTLNILRDEGVMIIASGNIVHNLRKVDSDFPYKGYPWAEAFDAFVKQNILTHDHAPLLRYEAAPGGTLSVPTPDHYLPLIYALGATDPTDKVTVFNDARAMGSLSMTGYLFHS